MARKVGISTNAVLSFIAPDDEAIGDTSPEAYNKYVETASVEHLQLTGRPVRYYVKVMNSRAWQKMVDVFKVLEGRAAEDAEFTPEQVDNLDMNLRLLFSDILHECLVGCDEHPDVRGINDDGSFDIVKYSWRPGDKAPEGLLASVLADTPLMTNIVNFLIRVSTLKETEKNR